LVETDITAFGESTTEANSKDVPAANRYLC